MLHVVGRERGTIKQAAEKLLKNGRMHQTQPRTRGCAAARKGWKATIVSTIHDKIYHLRNGGVGGGQLRHKDNRQMRINEPRRGRTPDFEFEIIYIQQVNGHATKFDLS